MRAQSAGARISSPAPTPVLAQAEGLILTLLCSGGADGHQSQAARLGTLPAACPAISQPAPFCRYSGCPALSAAGNLLGPSAWASASGQGLRRLWRALCVPKILPASPAVDQEAQAHWPRERSNLHGQWTGSCCGLPQTVPCDAQLQGCCPMVVACTMPQSCGSPQHPLCLPPSVRRGGSPCSQEHADMVAQSICLD